MDASSSPDDSKPVSSSDEDQIDRLCDAFEAQWKQGESPSIEFYLAKVSDTSRLILLPELIWLELDYRQRGDESPTLDEYRQRFSEHVGIVEDVFRNRQLGKSLDSPGSRQIVPANTTAADVPATLSRGQPQRLRSSHGLQVRCPHCREAIEIIMEMPWADITCTLCGSQFSLVDSAQSASDRTLTRLAHFELLSQLGTGSFGTVWKARDTMLDRMVAVKVPRRGQMDRLQMEQFLREARVAAQLSHPNIVGVHEVGQDQGTVYIVSDLILGETLSDWLNEEQPTYRESVELCAKVADALHHAHVAGVVHRDLKPANIMLDEQGEPHVMDFGLAKREAGEITMTVDGQILGTPAYMSPEQARGQGHWSDRRSDVYSLGVMLFQLLTGQRPFLANNRATLITQVLTEEAPSPRKFDARIPRDLETICLKCLEKDPNARYQSAKSLAEELRRYLRGEPIIARPLGRLQRAWRWCRRKPMTASVIGLVGLILLASPPVATIQYSLRRTVEKQNEERLNLIQRLEREREAIDTQLKEVTFDFDRLRSRYEAISPPQVYSLKLARAHYESISPAEADTTEDRTQRLYRLLGMASIQAALQSEEEALQTYKEAIDLLAQLAKERPNEIAFRVAQARCLLAMGRIDQSLGRFEEASARIRAAIALCRSISADFPSHLRYVVELEQAMEQLALVQGDQRDNAGALTTFEDAGQLIQSLDGRLPSDAETLYRVVCQLLRVKPMLESVVQSPATELETTDTP